MHVSRVLLAPPHVADGRHARLPRGWRVGGPGRANQGPEGDNSGHGRRDARFTGDVSHELRSPLTTMVNASEVLQRRRAELPVTARQAADLLACEVQQFRHMVVDLLEIARA